MQGSSTRETVSQEHTNSDLRGLVLRDKPSAPYQRSPKGKWENRVEYFIQTQSLAGIFAVT